MGKFIALWMILIHTMLIRAYPHMSMAVQREAVDQVAGESLRFIAIFTNMLYVTGFRVQHINTGVGADPQLSYAVFRQ